mmetsp:Transcript_15287/g.49930  ORF Transcript_15287/g.49930 Transcript_15287/m.49930 type:complete len:217 (-) Transcript_15287:1210-1860(-)
MASTALHISPVSVWMSPRHCTRPESAANDRIDAAWCRTYIADFADLSPGDSCWYRPRSLISPRQTSRAVCARYTTAILSMARELSGTSIAPGRASVALRGMPLSPVAGEETVPMLQHFAQHYNDISQRRGDVARIYAVRAQDKEFGLCHTDELGRFCPSMLPSAQRIPPIGDLHAAEHLSSPETGHARCCRGPRSVDRVPGGVRGDGQKHAAVGGD